MAGSFDADCYMAHKVGQLGRTGVTDANGKFYTVETLKAYFAENGVDPEAHYNEYGRGENQGVEKSPKRLFQGGLAKTWFR